MIIVSRIFYLFTAVNMTISKELKEGVITYIGLLPENNVIDSGTFHVLYIDKIHYIGTLVDFT